MNRLWHYSEATVMGWMWCAASSPAASTHLAQGGRLIIEFGFGQAPALGVAARAAGWEIVRMIPDLQNIPRVAVLRR